MILKDKSILVTGASSGIGRTVCKEVSEEGAVVSLLARNENRLKETMQSLQGDGHHIYMCDLTSDSDLDVFVDRSAQLDGIVFCAGINDYLPVKNISLEKTVKMFQTNYFSQILLVQKLLKAKKINNGASLVFISSVSSLIGVPGTLLYASSKGAINSAVKVLASELAPKGIRANAICPGVVCTPMIGDSAISDDQLIEESKRYPLGLGSPENVADAVVFHLSDKSKWLTGNIMVLDGGFSLQ